MTQKEFVAALNAAQKKNELFFAAHYISRNDGFGEFYEMYIYDHDEDDEDSAAFALRELNEEYENLSDLPWDESRRKQMDDIIDKMRVKFFDWLDVPEELKSLEIVYNEYSGTDQINVVVQSKEGHFARTSCYYSSYNDENYLNWREFKSVKPVERTVTFYEEN